MRNTVGFSQRLKRAWLDDLLDRLVQTRDEKELRAFVDQRLSDELPGNEARAKAAGILLRIWSGVDAKHIALRDRAVALLPGISGQDRVWLHWGMSALAYPFFRDLAEVIGRMLTLQDDFTTAQVQARMKTTWGDRATSMEAAQKLVTSMVDWEVLRATKMKGHFLLARKMTSTVTDLQLWLLEAMLSASVSEEIEAHQLLRLPESFPFSLTVSVGDLRRHEGFNIHRQGLDMDMVSIRHVKAEPPPKLPAKAKKPKKIGQSKQDEPTLFDELTPQVASGPIWSEVAPSPVGCGPQGYESTRLKHGPYRALVLVRNLSSSTHKLDFGEFVLTSIGHPQYLDLRKTLSSLDVYIGDWLLEKTYSVLPDSTGPSPSGIGGIPNDIEDIQLLLRLYKVGDMVFTKQAVVNPDGESLVQHPYRFVNGLNSHSVLVTDLGEDDRDPWRTFASTLRSSQSWNAPWFSVSRRFFLYGGAKEFNPKWDEVDRIVDYATALESALVPEGDFSKARCANRAAPLCSSAPTEQKSIASLVRKLYDIRSSIVHGTLLSEDNRVWLTENSGEVELRVRQVLVAAVQQSPPDDVGRIAFLRSLFDVADEKRGEFTLQMFRQIKTEGVRSTTAAHIAKLQAKRK